MALTTVAKVRLLTNLATSDISDADITSMITQTTSELNRLINVKIIREKIEYIDETRENKIDGSNTTYYVRNWRGKYLADMDNDGDVDASDIIVYAVDSDGIETTATVSSVTPDEGKFVLSSAYTSGYSLYVTYEWCYKDVSTPDPIIETAATLLTAAYCYAKINIGRSPQVAFGNTRIYRHIDAFDEYYKRFLNVISKINNQIGDGRNSELTI